MFGLGLSIVMMDVAASLIARYARQASLDCLCRFGDHSLRRLRRDLAGRLGSAAVFSWQPKFRASAVIHTIFDASGYPDDEPATSFGAPLAAEGPLMIPSYTAPFTSRNGLAVAGRAAFRMPISTEGQT